jgi:hypothetical protein
LNVTVFEDLKIQLVKELDGSLAPATIPVEIGALMVYVDKWWKSRSAINPTLEKLLMGSPGADLSAFAVDDEGDEIDDLEPDSVIPEAKSVQEPKGGSKGAYDAGYAAGVDAGIIKGKSQSRKECHFCQDADDGKSPFTGHHRSSLCFRLADPKFNASLVASVTTAKAARASKFGQQKRVGFSGAGESASAVDVSWEFELRDQTEVYSESCSTVLESERCIVVDHDDRASVEECNVNLESVKPGALCTITRRGVLKGGLGRGVSLPDAKHNPLSCPLYRFISMAHCEGTRTRRRYAMCTRTTARC